MFDNPKEECGVVGITTNTDASRLAFFASVKLALFMLAPKRLACIFWKSTKNTPLKNSPCKNSPRKTSPCKKSDSKISCCKISLLKENSTNF